MRRIEYAALHSPERTLHGCVYLAVERDTRKVQLSDAERFNYYPATPFPSISWLLDGQLHMVEAGLGDDAPRLGKPLPKVIFSGPTRGPSASWSPASLHVLTICFYPEALARLLDITIQQYVGSILPLEKVMRGPALDQLLAVDFRGAACPFGQIHELLNSLWEDVAAERSPDVRSWLTALAIRTSSITGPAGRRGMQRLVKSWTGQSFRDLQLYARVENAMSQAGRMLDEEGFSLADVAAATGFADQSHFGREVRRVTGLPPAKLNELFDRDEAFWMYRLLRRPARLTS